MNAFDELVTLCGLAKGIEAEADDLRRQGVLGKAIGTAPILTPEVRRTLATATELNALVDSFADHVQGGRQPYVRPSRPTSAAPIYSPRFPAPPEPKPGYFFIPSVARRPWAEEKARLSKSIDDAFAAGQISPVQLIKLETQLNIADTLHCRGR